MVSLPCADSFNHPPPPISVTTLYSPNRLREVAALFLKLGLFAFGGPAAHIAMMREEVVRRRRWLEDQEFLDMVGATNLIPGPNSTELAIHLGHRRAGWKGLFAAGGLFIIPAVLIVLVIAFLYVEYGTTPAFEWALYGIKPVVIAIILKALLGLGKTALKGPLTAVIGGGVLAGYLLGVNELLLLAGAGALAVAARFGGRIKGGSAAALALPAAFPLLGGLSAGAASFSMVTLFLNFLKVGAVLYGSGYVLLAYLRGDFVERLGWLTETQLLDAISVGQLTPGPVFTTATFVGYVVDGWTAAIVATVAIFVPSFIFVAALSRILPWARRTPSARAALDGVNAASLALMAGVTWQLGRVSLEDPFTIATAVVAAVLVFRTSLNPMWFIIAGGAAGAIARAAGV